MPSRAKILFYSQSLLQKREGKTGDNHILIRLLLSGVGGEKKKGGKRNPTGRGGSCTRPGISVRNRKKGREKGKSGEESNSKTQPVQQMSHSTAREKEKRKRKRQVSIYYIMAATRGGKGRRRQTRMGKEGSAATEVAWETRIPLPIKERERRKKG